MFVYVLVFYLFPSKGLFVFDLGLDLVIKVNNCAVVFGFL